MCGGEGRRQCEHAAPVYLGDKLLDTERLSGRCADYCGSPTSRYFAQIDSDPQAEELGLTGKFRENKMSCISELSFAFPGPTQALFKHVPRCGDSPSPEPPWGSGGKGRIPVGVGGRPWIPDRQKFYL